ncbi:MAG: adenosylcobalamin-dependent ribonucleoside-diphosphate reductase [Bdellovibrionota bacterium]
MKTKVFKVNSQLKVTAPATWSPNAVEIAATKYFRQIKAGKKESSVPQLINRVSHAIGQQVKIQKLLPGGINETKFIQSLENILLQQQAAFNSPVWFNVGLYEAYGIKTSSPHWAINFKTKKPEPVGNNFFQRPQASACFIQSGPSDLNQVMDLAETENLLFRYGSGTGSNFSTLPSRFEQEAPGAPSPGILNYLDFLDRGAALVKSGGVARRAAKMVVLNVDHPEILEFICWKREEEKKAKTLISQGFDAGFEGETYRFLSGQNANNSVRVTDAFMKAVLGYKEWTLKSVHGRGYNIGTGKQKINGQTAGGIKLKTIKKIPAQKIWDQLVEAAWFCADPGLQFHDTINHWNPCRESMEINASNPCSEYMFIDDSACNLASINLCSLLEGKELFRIEEYIKLVDTLIRSQEALVDYASYPTKQITQNSHDYRPLGLGFANLGALLMRMDLPYDSDEGRHLAALLSSLMTAQAYKTSCELAKSKGPFPLFSKNKKSFLRVLRQHNSSHKKLLPQIKANKFSKQLFPDLYSLAEKTWEEVLQMAAKTGVRNAQVTLLAPTGTIGLLMDCDTLGIEPEFSLLKHKVLSGGGSMEIENKSVHYSLENSEYSEAEKKDVLNYLLQYGHLQGAPHLSQHQQKVFACATGPGAITPEAHLKMMAAAQPFLSGAISKTVNCPSNTTLEQISELYIQAWKMGLKSVAVYRDGSKGSQPLNSVQECGTGECTI